MRYDIHPAMQKGYSLFIRIFFAELLVIVLCQRSLIPLSDPIEKVRAYTRSIEFDYTTWTLDALLLKNSQNILNLQNFLSASNQKQMVLDYAKYIRQKQDLSDQILQTYSDPNIKNPDEASADLKNQLDQTNAILKQISPTAESILQSQTSAVISKLGLSTGGQLIPALEFHATPLPLALIVSPRNVIQQDANISLQTDLTLDQMISLESATSKALNVSTLVEEVGGIGTYPTMVQQTSDLNWLTTVIAHEWTHNYLDFRPLGLNYDTTPELRTINETTASIAGDEIGAMVIKTYYPELAPKPAPVQTQPSPNAPSPASQPPAFDFRAVMHETRVTVDEMLKQGKITGAESYMEQQRQYIWDNGYQIRKLNQAYFAFHGAYADTPGGAAGADPVGPAVRALRKESGSLADFINKISWMTSFEQLQKSVNQADLQ
jgi:hypothetical protein